MAFIPPIEFHRIVKSMPRRTKAVLMACDGPTPYKDTLIFFRLICHPFTGVTQSYTIISKQ